MSETQNVSSVPKNYDLTMTVTLRGNWKNGRKSKDAVKADFEDVAAGLRAEIEDQLQYMGTYRWSITDATVSYNARPA